MPPLKDKSDILKLIRAIKAQPKLYNRTLNIKRPSTVMEKEKQQQTVNMLWERVGRKMFDDWSRFSESEKSHQVQLLKRKWHNLWDSFVKEHRFRSKGKLNQAGTFAFYDKLMFIFPYTQRGKNTNITKTNTLCHNEEPKKRPVCSNRKHPVCSNSKSEVAKEQENPAKQKLTSRTQLTKKALKTQNNVYSRRKAENDKKKDVMKQNPRDILNSPSLSVSLTRINPEHKESINTEKRYETREKRKASFLNQERNNSILVRCKASENKAEILSSVSPSTKIEERTKDATNQEISEPQMAKLISEALLRTKLEIEDRKNIVISENQMAKILSGVLSLFWKKDKPIRVKKEEDNYSTDKFGNRAFLLSCLPLLDSLTVEHCLEVKMKILKDIHEVSAKSTNMDVICPPSDMSNSSHQLSPKTPDQTISADNDVEEPSSNMKERLAVQKQSPSTHVEDTDFNFGEIVSYTTLDKLNSNSKSRHVVLDEEEVEKYLETMKDINTDITNALISLAH